MQIVYQLHSIIEYRFYVVEYINCWKVTYIVETKLIGKFGFNSFSNAVYHQNTAFADTNTKFDTNDVYMK